MSLTLCGPLSLLSQPLSKETLGLVLLLQAGKAIIIMSWPLADENMCSFCRPFLHPECIFPPFAIHTLSESGVH